MRYNIAVKAGKQAKKGVLRVIFSRTALILLLILMQLSTFAGLLTILRDYMVYIYGVMLVIQAGVIIYIMNEQTCPEFSLTWILLILIFPVFGCAFYVYAKMELGTHFFGEQLKERQMETWPYLKQKKTIIEDLRASKAANANLAHYMNRSLHFPQYKGDLFQLRGGKISGALGSAQKGGEVYFSGILYRGRGLHVGLHLKCPQAEGGPGRGGSVHV